MKDNSLDNWYRDSFEQTPGGPPDAVWDNIAGELDAAPPFAFRKVLLAAALLLFTSAGIISYFIFSEEAKSVLPQVAHADPHHQFFMYDDAGSRVDVDVLTLSPITDIAARIANDYQAKMLAEKDKPTPAFIASTAPAVPTFSEPIVEDLDGSILIAELEEQLEQAEQLKAQQAEFRAEVFFTPLPPSEQMNSLQASNYRLLGSKIEQDPASRARHTILLNNETVPQGYYVGTALTINHIWALNSDTYNGWDKESLSVNNSKIGAELSLVGGLNISDTRGIQSELSLFKSGGQSHSEYADGEYVTSDLQLQYSQINFLFKRRHSRYLFHEKVPTSISVLAGPYVAFLRGANLNQNGRVSDIRDEYMNYDVGLDIGLEYDLYFSSRWAVSTSLRSSIGMVNVFAGNTKVPRDFNRTRNFSLGAQVGLKYMLGK